MARKTAERGRAETAAIAVFDDDASRIRVIYEVVLRSLSINPLMKTT